MKSLVAIFDEAVDRIRRGEKVRDAAPVKRARTEVKSKHESEVCEEVKKLFQEEAKRNPVTEGKQRPPITHSAPQRPKREKHPVCEADLCEIMPTCRICERPNTGAFNEEGGIVCTECGYVISNDRTIDSLNCRRYMEPNTYTPERSNVATQRAAMERLEAAQSAARTAEEKRRSAVRQQVHVMLSHFSKEVDNQQVEQAVDYAMNKIGEGRCDAPAAALAGLRYVFAPTKGHAALPLSHSAIKPINAKTDARATVLFNRAPKGERKILVAATLSKRFVRACQGEGKEGLAANASLSGVYGKLAAALRDRLTEDNYKTLAHCVEDLVDYAVTASTSKADWHKTALPKILESSEGYKTIATTVDLLLANQLFLAESSVVEERLKRVLAILNAD